MMKLLLTTVLVAFAAGVTITGKGTELINGEPLPSGVDGTRLPGVCNGGLSMEVFQLDAEGESIGEITVEIVVAEGLDTLDGDFRVEYEAGAGSFTVIFEPVSTNAVQRQVAAHVSVHNTAGDVVFDFGVGSAVTGAFVQLEDPLVAGVPVTAIDVQTETTLKVARYGICKTDASPVATAVTGQGFSAAVAGDEIVIAFNAAEPGTYEGEIVVLAPEELSASLYGFIPVPEEDPSGGGDGDGDGDGDDDATCVDTLVNGIAWADYYGENCQWYELNNKCASLGDGDADANGITANMACCVCGGGGDSSEPQGPICEDLTQPNGAPWYDNYAETGEYGCQSYYNKASNCARDGSNFERFGLVANQACCACGGGSSGSDAQAEEEEYVPITCSSLLVEIDDGSTVKWHDSYGAKYDCAYYTDNDKCDRKYWGGEQPNVFYELSAKEACCGCGGGEACEDATLASGAVWHDSENEEATCEWYSKNGRCEDFGSANANEGMTAKEACCACKQ